MNKQQSFYWGGGRLSQETQAPQKKKFLEYEFCTFVPNYSGR